MSVAIGYDERFLEHDHPGHPENPGRLRAIVEKLQETGQFDILPKLQERRASGDEVQAVHSPEMLAGLLQLATRGGGWVDPDTYVNPGSLDIAMLAAGLVIEAAERVAAGDHESAFCLVRPPGHHATAERAMGFCLVNNVAVATRCVRRSQGVGKVAIVDFDVHHGNGTQDIFWTDPSVLYISTHQYPYYPGTGHWSETGAGDGVGSTINIPLPPYCSDAAYARLYDEVVGPALRRFAPELIFVSAGFDSHERDPLAMESLSSGGYVALAGRLRDWAAELCAGKCVFVLEGGYDYQALGESVSGILSVLEGGEWADTGVTHGPDVSDLIERVRTLHGLSGVPAPGQNG